MVMKVMTTMPMIIILGDNNNSNNNDNNGDLDNDVD